MSAPLRAAAVFEALAGQPVPSYGVMIANLLVFCAAAGGVEFIRVATAMPDLLPGSPALLAILAAAGLLLSVPMSFLGAAVLHSFMLLCGGTGGFARSYQAFSMLGAAAVLQSLLNWVAAAWALPSLLAAYLAAVAARTLLRAAPLRSAAVFSLLAALSIAGQWRLREATARWARAARDMRQAAASVRDFSGRLQRLQAPPQPSTADETTIEMAALSGAPSQNNAAVSGLDLLRGPQAGGPAVSPEQARAAQQAAADILRPMLGMLDNPQLTKKMPPAQARQMAELAGLLKEMRESMAGGRNLPPGQTADMTRKLQAMALQIMSQARAMPANPQAAAPPSPGGGAAARTSREQPPARGGN